MVEALVAMLIEEVVEPLNDPLALLVGKVMLPLKVIKRPFKSTTPAVCSNELPTVKLLPKVTVPDVRATDKRYRLKLEAKVRVPNAPLPPMARTELPFPSRVPLPDKLPVMVVVTVLAVGKRKVVPLPITKLFEILALVVDAIDFCPDPLVTKL